MSLPAFAKVQGAERKMVALTGIEPTDELAAWARIFRKPSATILAFLAKRTLRSA